MKYKAMRRILATALILIPTVSSQLFAQDSDPSISADLAEGTRLRSSLEVGASYSDNFFYARGSDDQEQGSGLIVRPELTLSHVLSRFSFTGKANGELARFDLPGDIDDYSDYGVSLGSEWHPAFRHRFGFGANLNEDHDPFGTARTEDSALEEREIDQWRRVRTNLKYFYGIPSDRYNFELGADSLNKEYTNNRDITQYLDYEIAGAFGRAFYTIGAKTSIYAMIAAQRSYYEEIAPGAFDRGAVTQQYFIGTRWLATAKTSGDIRVGYVLRDPRSPERDDFRHLDWQAQLTWAPRAVRSFEFVTGRTSQESFLNTVDFIDSRYAALSWLEQWTQRFRTKLGGRYTESAFIGSSRVDDSTGYSLSGEWDFTRTLKMLGVVSNVQREADTSYANYEQFYAYLGVRYTR